MKLIHTGYDLEIVLRENQITVLSVENPQAYSAILRDIWNQTQGGEGDFILSDNEKMKNISKEIDCVFNPFALDCNDKRIITKVYQELKEQAGIYLVNEGAVLNGSIIEYLDKLLEHVPYALDYHMDFDVLNFLKLYGVKIDTCGGSLLEKIVEYLRVLSQVCSVKNFLFVGLKQYLTVEELKQLYEFVFYEKINLIIVESVHSQRVAGEKCWLLDKDLCIIDL